MEKQNWTQSSEENVMRIKEDYSMRGWRKNLFMSLVKIIFIIMKHKIKTENSSDFGKKK